LKEGYIITNENDTLTGQIDFRTDIQNAVSCKFKLSVDSSVTEYTVADLKGYAIPGENKYYVARFVEIDNLQRKVFLEKLFKGVVDLYFYAPSSQINYYFLEDARKENSSFSILRVYNSLGVSDHVEHQSIQNEYFRNKGTLRYLFQDAPSMNDDINKMNFWKKDIIAMVKKYHQSVSGEDFKFEVSDDVKQNYTSFDFIVYAGISFLKHSFDDYEMAQFSSVNSTNPVIGVQLNICYPRLSKSLSALVDLSVTKISGDKEVRLEGLNTNRKYEYDLTLAGTKVGLRYSFLDSKVSPIIEAGGILSFTLSRSSTLYETQLASNTVREYKDYRLPESFSYGFYAGAGLEYRLNTKYSLMATVRYEYLTASHEESLNSVLAAIGFKF